jgi:predicted nuclease with TOPRIM domain
MPAEEGEQALVDRLQRRIKELTSRNAALRDLAARRRDRIKRLTARLERTPPNPRANTMLGRCRRFFTTPIASLLNWIRH